MGLPRAAFEFSAGVWHSVGRSRLSLRSTARDHRPGRPRAFASPLPSPGSRPLALSCCPPTAALPLSPSHPHQPIPRPLDHGPRRSPPRALARRRPARFLRAPAPAPRIAPSPPLPSHVGPDPQSPGPSFPGQRPPDAPLSHKSHTRPLPRSALISSTYNVDFKTGFGTIPRKFSGQITVDGWRYSGAGRNFRAAFPIWASPASRVGCSRAPLRSGRRGRRRPSAPFRPLTHGGSAPKPPGFFEA